MPDCHIEPVPSTATYAVILRDYQTDGVGAIREAFGEHTRLCYVLPTGGGKTVIFAFITYHAMRKGSRTLILAHRIEIVDQISAALTLMGVPHGMIVAGARSIGPELIQVGMVQTVANRLHRLETPDFIVIDECHHAVAGTWAKVLHRFAEAYVLGVTATPERLDGRGLREVGFEQLILGPDVAWLIENGYLARFRYLGAEIDVSFDSVRTVGGDYDTHELEALLATKAITGDVVGHYRKHLDGRTCIVFCVTVKHAEMVAEAYRDAGIPAASIDGSMGKLERAEVVRQLRTGEIMVLTSVAVLGEGFDAPEVGGAQLLRPTQSFAMFRQQIGRCLRPKADGSAAIILDHVQNYTRHGLPDEAHVWDLDSQRRTPAERKQQVPTRLCRACGEVFGVNAKGTPCGPPDCLWQPVAPIVQRPGTLGEIRRPTPEQAMAWAQGNDLKRGRLRLLLALAGGDRRRLTQIAAARGYKRGWVYYKQIEYSTKTGPVWGDVYSLERTMG